MKFGEFPIGEAHGCILAHTIRLSDVSLKKGKVLVSNDLEKLREAGITSVTGVCLESGDVGEDSAATRIAKAVSGCNLKARPASTGRVNLIANEDGIFQIDIEKVININRIDEAMTLATLPTNSRVRAGQLVATVKIIPFSVSEESLSKLEAVAKTGEVQLAVHGFQGKKVALILSRLSGDAEKLVGKRRQAMEKRVFSLSGSLIDVTICMHTAVEVAGALQSTYDLRPDIILVFGASSIVDRADIIPAALTLAGGEIVQLGMPVDPGNLLLLGTLIDTTVIGVPSCAASLKDNGFDWVLERLFAELPLDKDHITAMAAGGLLSEISTRPMPRELE